MRPNKQHVPHAMVATAGGTILGGSGVTPAGAAVSPAGIALSPPPPLVTPPGLVNAYPYDPADILENIGSTAAFVTSSASNPTSIARLRAKRAYPITVYATTLGLGSIFDPSGTGVQKKYLSQVGDPSGRSPVPRMRIAWGAGKQSQSSIFSLRRPITFVAEYVEAFAVIQDPTVVPGSGVATLGIKYAAVWSAAMAIGHVSELALPTLVVQSASGGYTNAGGISIGGGTLYSLTGYNSGAASTYLQLYDFGGESSVGLTVPIWETLVAAGAFFSLDYGSRGREFGSGLAWACSTTPAVLTAYDAAAKMRVDAEIGAF